MSDIFDKREKAFEDIFGHELEVEYKARACADLYFGLWAAEQLKITDPTQARDYARNLMANEAIHAKRAIEMVLVDFEQAELQHNRNDLNNIYAKFYKKAREEV